MTTSKAEENSEDGQKEASIRTSEQAEIDRIMNEIVELQKQMADLAVTGPTHSMFEKSALAKAAKVKADSPIKDNNSMDSNTSSPASSNTLSNTSNDAPISGPPPAPNLTLVSPPDPSTLVPDLAVAVPELPVVVPDLALVPDLTPVSVAPDPSPSTIPTEITELFKDIEGGEEALLAETLAGLPTRKPEKSTEENSPKSEPTPTSGHSHHHHHHHGEPQADAGPLESESLLASILNPTLPVLENVSLSAAPNPLKNPETKSANPMEPSPKVNSSDNSLSMTVTGQMSLKLNFEYEGQEIWVNFNTEVIHIQFSEGTEFKIPLKRGQSKKAA